MGVNMGEPPDLSGRNAATIGDHSDSIGGAPLRFTCS